MLGAIYDVILSIYVLGRDKVKRADLVILAPAPPVRQLLMGFWTIPSRRQIHLISIPVNQNVPIASAMSFLKSMSLSSGKNEFRGRIRRKSISTTPRSNFIKELRGAKQCCGSSARAVI